MNKSSSNPPSPILFSKLCTDFPHLIPCDVSFSAFAGFIQVQGQEFRVRITANCSEFQVDDRLRAILSSHEKIVSQRLKCADNPHDFLIDIRDLLERIKLQPASITQGATKNSTNTRCNERSDMNLPSISYYNTLLKQLSQIGWQHVHAMDKRLRNVQLSMNDECDRVHTIQIDLPLDYPNSLPVTNVDLPCLFKPCSSSLPAIYRQFIQSVNSFKSLFDAIDDLDEHTLVLEPQLPTRKDIERRIAISSSCAVASIRIALDPSDPLRAYPRCRLLGPDRTIAPLRTELNQRMHLWDTSGNVMPRQNLEHVLNITFPPKPRSSQVDGNGEEEEEDVVGHCGICYASRRDEKISDIACERDECQVMYHRTCLVEWLRTLPDTRESFETLTGKCVYCEHTITVPTKEVENL